MCMVRHDFLDHHRPKSWKSLPLHPGSKRSPELMTSCTQNKPMGHLAGVMGSNPGC